jgi:predicted ATPase/class 3 adenylate cyclase/Tfp pilus assembly protein PilF
MSTLRALLLTDVVDSTRVTQALGDAAMEALWAAHDRAARDLLPVWHGREIDKTDGLLLLFERAADAAGYALAYHRALAALGLPIKARAGLHVGPVTLRENSAADVALGAKPLEVEGMAKPVAARVMSAAQGGQTLLTDDARRALGETALRVQSHGHWRLQGLSEPIELHEVGDDDAPFSPPPDQAKAYRVVRQGELWQPVREVRHSLPAERDGFVGRDEPLRQLAHKLEGGARLVSVLGIGGAGKTRLATRFAWTWLGDFPGGVWFCDLSQARTLDGVCFAVAQGLDVPLGKGDPVLQLAQAIAGRGRCLVIFDNFEQVARLAEETVGRWLDRAPLAKFVVTTREVLGIVGEEALALAPLPAADAAALFLRRAASAKQGFLPSADDLAAIDQLVKVLDGLPLAIELAAARVRVMPPRTLLARMSERFKVLWSSAGRQDRQATLRAAFDWSWELLSAPEKVALAQLSVFEGGVTLESAEAVLDLSASAAPWTVDVMHWLVDKSFVRQVADDRFDLLESVRDYAAEHLGTEGRFPGSGPAAADAARRRHWHYFAGLDERAAAGHGGIEASNLVAACRRAVAAADAPAAVGALVNAWAVLRLRGPMRVGADLAALVSGLPGLTAGQQAAADWVAGSALYVLGDATQARETLAAGLAQAGAVGDRRGEARLRVAAAVQHAAEGRLDDALDDLTRALALARELADRSLQCMALNGLGSLAVNRADLEGARGHYEAALAEARELGDRRLEGGVLGNLGNLLHDQGRLDDARRHYDLALALAREVGDRRWEGNERCNLGLLHHDQGRSAQARTEFETALTMAREIGHVRLEGTVLCNLGLVLEAQGELDAARSHYDKAVTVAHAVGDPRLEGQFRGYLGLLEARIGRFAEGRSCLSVGESLLLETSDRLSLGLLLCGRAEAEHLAGDPVEARHAWQRAQALAAPADMGADSELGRAMERLRTLFEPARTD